VTGPTADDIRIAYPEWQFTLSGDGWWHARLTTNGEPRPELTARTVAGLAEQINDLIGGDDRG
jgi:broad specificity phosphatase PhoE